MEVKRIKGILEDGIVAREVNREEQLKEAKQRQERFEETSKGNNIFGYLSGALNATIGGAGYVANQIGAAAQNWTGNQPKQQAQPQYYPNQFPGGQQPKPNTAYGAFGGGFNPQQPQQPQYPGMPYYQAPPYMGYPPMQYGYPGWNQYQQYPPQNNPNQKRGY